MVTFTFLVLKTNFMEFNVVVISILVVAIALFIVFVIKRNKKDRKDLEKELNQKELTPDKNDQNLKI